MLACFEFAIRGATSMNGKEPGVTGYWTIIDHLCKFTSSMTYVARLCISSHGPKGAVLLYST